MNGPPTLLMVFVAASCLGTSALWLAGGNGVMLDTLAVIEQRKGVVIVIFAVWALVANCLVLPAGSMSLMAGGALLGTMLPATLWFAAQLITAPFVYRAGAAEPTRAGTLVARYLGATAAALLASAARDGVWATVVLRLTPVLPSAPAALIAAWAGIDLRAFMIGSAMAGWLRPLYFASLGAAAGTLARVDDWFGTLLFSHLLPLTVPCGCVAVVFCVRIYLVRSRH